MPLNTETNSVDLRTVADKFRVDCYRLNRQFGNQLNLLFGKGLSNFEIDRWKPLLPKSGIWLLGWVLEEYPNG